MIELLTRDDLAVKPYNLTPAFIRRNFVALGGKGRGRAARFPRMVVEAFLDQYFLDEHRQAIEDAEAHRRVLEEIERSIAVRDAARYAIGGVILGKGGRKASATA